MIDLVSLLRVPYVKSMGEPYTGNLYVRFDEGRGVKTRVYSTVLNLNLNNCRSRYFHVGKQNGGVERIESKWLNKKWNQKEDWKLNAKCAKYAEKRDKTGRKV